MRTTLTIATIITLSIGTILFNTGCEFQPATDADLQSDAEFDDSDVGGAVATVECQEGEETCRCDDFGLSVFFRCGEHGRYFAVESCRVGSTCAKYNNTPGHSRAECVELLVGEDNPCQD